MGYTWNWGMLLEASPNGEGTNLNLLLSGLGWTLVIAAGAWTIAMVLGTIVGVMRTRQSIWLTAPARAYVEFFRNIPVIVQLFLWYFVLPELVPATLGSWIKQLEFGSYYTAILGMGFYMAARVAEQVRSGLLAIPRGQAMACASIGMTPVQSLRFVLLPRAFRIIMPTLTTDLMNAVKNPSVASTIGVLELTAQAHAIQEATFQVFEAFTAATALYVVTNVVVVMSMRALERRLAIPGYLSAK